MVLITRSVHADSPTSWPFPPTTSSEDSSLLSGSGEDVRWAWGHAGYHLTNVRGMWHASEANTADHGAFFGVNDDRFLIIAGLGLSVRFIEVHDGLDDRGHSFDVDQLVINLRGNAFTKRLAYQVSLFSSRASSSVSLLDAQMAFALLPGKISLRVGLQQTDINPEATTELPHLQLAARSLAARFFFVDRNTGVQATLTPFSRPERQLTVKVGLWDQALSPAQPAAASFNVDPGFMYSLGVDYDRGPTFGVREGDFSWSSTPRIRVGLRGAYGRIDQVPAAGELGLRGQLLLGNARLGAKFRGASLLVDGFARWQRLNTLDQDLLDFGVNVQAGYFVWRRRVEVVARYSELWPDVRNGGPARDLPRASPASPPADLLAQGALPARQEAGGGLRVFPFSDPQFNVVAVYLWRDVDSIFLLQMSGWL